MDEMTTLGCVLAGASLARYGDGEFRLCEGLPAKAQSVDRTLSQRLRDILRFSGDCHVGIPNLHSETPKEPFWRPYLHRAPTFLVERMYSSAFITRPDSAPWIDTPEYWEAIEAIWRDQDVTIVSGGRHGLRAPDLIGARSVRMIDAPSTDAWVRYDDLLDQIGRPAKVLLCLGPTATVMAVDLCAMGVQAIDLGHLGLFLRKHRSGEPMIRTEADRVQ
jgi:hypothetical protein